MRTHVAAGAAATRWAYQPACPCEPGTLTQLPSALPADIETFTGAWGAPDDTAALQAVLAGLIFTVCHLNV